MQPITVPLDNTHHSDEVLAQSVAGDLDSGWQEENGRIYDQHGKLVADSMTQAAVAMRDLGWFVPKDAQGSGVWWKKVPNDGDEHEAKRADAVRAEIARASTGGQA